MRSEITEIYFRTSLNKCNLILEVIRFDFVYLALKVIKKIILKNYYS